jgi:hypothetical protein
MDAIRSLNTRSSLPDHQHFAHLVQMTLKAIEAKTSKRAYRLTYGKWLMWCKANQFDPADLRPGYVVIFLNEQITTKASRQRHLAGLRRLAETDYTLNPSDDTRYILQALHTIKVAPFPHIG